MSLLECPTSEEHNESANITRGESKYRIGLYSVCRISHYRHYPVVQSSHCHIQVRRVYLNSIFKLLCFQFRYYNLIDLDAVYKLFYICITISVSKTLRNGEHNKSLHAHIYARTVCRRILVIIQLKSLFKLYQQEKHIYLF